MSPLLLHCSLCGRKQAEGLLSRNAWGYVEYAEGQTLRACPGCRATYVDWEHRLLAATTGETPYGTRFGGVYR